MSEPSKKPSTSKNDVDEVENKSESDLELAPVIADNEEDQIVTIEEFKEMLDEDLDVAETAVGVLGDSDEECSYLKGYVKRQSLYACATCEMNQDENGEKYKAGVCFACMEHCHKGHEAYELYYKRNFCCDCGNDNFANNKCKFFDKTGFNEDNKYNQNFVGLYCFCNRPYPSEKDVLGEMFQCGICEDWFHSDHLNPKNPDNHAEMICESCVAENRFLIYYQEFGYFDIKPDADIEVTHRKILAELKKGLGVDTSAKCKLEELKLKYRKKYGTEKIEKSKVKTLYCPLEYRLKLCRCPKCWKMYEELDIPFICDPSDMTSLHQRGNLENDSDKVLKKFTPAEKRLILDGFKKWGKVMKDFFESKKGQTTAITIEDCQPVIEKLTKRRNNDDADDDHGIKYFCGLSESLAPFNLSKSANEARMSSERSCVLSVGTEVSAKYKGAFCEAKIKKVEKRDVRIKAQTKFLSAIVNITEETVVSGQIKVGEEVVLGDVYDNMPATIIKITDSSIYTVVFDDGDEATLKRNSLCLKSNKHYSESEPLDEFSLSRHEQHGMNPLRRCRRASIRSPQYFRIRNNANIHKDEDKCTKNQNTSRIDEGSKGIDDKNCKQGDEKSDTEELDDNGSKIDHVKENMPKETDSKIDQDISKNSDKKITNKDAEINQENDKNKDQEGVFQVPAIPKSRARFINAKRYLQSEPPPKVEPPKLVTQVVPVFPKKNTELALKSAEVGRVCRVDLKVDCDDWFPAMILKVTALKYKDGHVISDKNLEYCVKSFVNNDVFDVPKTIIANFDHIKMKEDIESNNEESPKLSQQLISGINKALDYITESVIPKEWEDVKMPADPNDYFYNKYPNMPENVLYVVGESDFCECIYDSDQESQGSEHDSEDDDEDEDESESSKDDTDDESASESKGEEEANNDDDDVVDVNDDDDDDVVLDLNDDDDDVVLDEDHDDDVVLDLNDDDDDVVLDEDHDDDVVLDLDDDDDAVLDVDDEEVDVDVDKDDEVVDVDEDDEVVDVDDDDNDDDDVIFMDEEDDDDHVVVLDEEEDDDDSVVIDEEEEQDDSIVVVDEEDEEMNPNDLKVLCTDSDSSDTEDSTNDDSDSEKLSDDDHENERKNLSQKISEESDLFVAKLYKFMDERRTPINGFPSINGNDINLYKLYRIVHKLGGLNRVNGKNFWKKIVHKMKLGTNATSATTTGNQESPESQLQAIYTNYLHPFHELNRKLGPASVLGDIRSSSTTSRPSRGERKREKERSRLISTSSDSGNKSSVTPTVTQEEKNIIEIQDDSSDASKNDLEKQKSSAEEENSSVQKEGETETRKDSESIQSESSVDNDQQAIVADSEVDSKSKTEEIIDISEELDETEPEITNTDESFDIPNEIIFEELENNIDEHSVPKIDFMMFQKNPQLGDCVSVKYSDDNGEESKIYDAKMTEIIKENDKPCCHVHYYGWSNRYDEWISFLRVVDVSEEKNVPKKFGNRSDLDGLETMSNEDFEYEGDRYEDEMINVAENNSEIGYPRGSNSVIDEDTDSNPNESDEMPPVGRRTFSISQNDEESIEPEAGTSGRSISITSHFEYQPSPIRNESEDEPEGIQSRQVYKTIDQKNEEDRTKMFQDNKESSMSKRKFETENIADLESESDLTLRAKKRNRRESTTETETTENIETQLSTSKGEEANSGLVDDDKVASTESMVEKLSNQSSNNKLRSLVAEQEAIVMCLAMQPEKTQKETTFKNPDENDATRKDAEIKIDSSNNDQFPIMVNMECKSEKSPKQIDDTQSTSTDATNSCSNSSSTSNDEEEDEEIKDILSAENIDGKSVTCIDLNIDVDSPGTLVVSEFQNECESPRDQVEIDGESFDEIKNVENSQEENSDAVAFPCGYKQDKGFNGNGNGPEKEASIDKHEKDGQDNHINDNGNDEEDVNQTANNDGNGDENGDGNDDDKDEEEDNDKDEDDDDDDDEKEKEKEDQNEDENDAVKVQNKNQENETNDAKICNPSTVVSIETEKPKEELEDSLLLCQETVPASPPCSPISTKETISTSGDGSQDSRFIGTTVSASEKEMNVIKSSLEPLSTNGRQNSPIAFSNVMLDSSSNKPFSQLIAAAAANQRSNPGNDTTDGRTNVLRRSRRISESNDGKNNGDDQDDDDDDNNGNDDDDEDENDEEEEDEDEEMAAGHEADVDEFEEDNGNERSSSRKARSFERKRRNQIRSTAFKANSSANLSSQESSQDGDEQSLENNSLKMSADSNSNSMERSACSKKKPGSKRLLSSSPMRADDDSSSDSPDRNEKDKTSPVSSPKKRRHGRLRTESQSEITEESNNLKFSKRLIARARQRTSSQNMNRYPNSIFTLGPYFSKNNPNDNYSKKSPPRAALQVPKPRTVDYGVLFGYKPTNRFNFLAPFDITLSSEEKCKVLLKRMKDLKKVYNEYKKKQAIFEKRKKTKNFQIIKKDEKPEEEEDEEDEEEDEDEGEGEDEVKVEVEEGSIEKNKKDEEEKEELKSGKENSENIAENDNDVNMEVGEEEEEQDDDEEGIGEKSNWNGYTNRLDYYKNLYKFLPPETD